MGIGSRRCVSETADNTHYVKLLTIGDKLSRCGMFSSSLLTSAKHGALQSWPGPNRRRGCACGNRVVIAEASGRRGEPISGDQILVTGGCLVEVGCCVLFGPGIHDEASCACWRERRRSGGQGHALENAFG